MQSQGSMQTTVKHCDVHRVTYSNSLNGPRCFTYRGVKLWNSLPTETKFLLSSPSKIKSNQPAFSLFPFVVNILFNVLFTLFTFIHVILLN